MFGNILNNVHSIANVTAMDTEATVTGSIGPRQANLGEVLGR